MSNPALARLDPDGDRVYRFGDEAFYSTTTIISGGVPKFLVAWASKAVAELAYSDLADSRPHARIRAALRRWSRTGRTDLLERQAAGELTSLKPAKMTDAEFALRWLKGQPDRIRDAAGAKGIDFHDEAERTILHLANETAVAGLPGVNMIRGEVIAAAPAWPSHLVDHRDAFLRFLEDWNPRYAATEMTVFNRREAYAGTLDAIIELPARAIVERLTALRRPVPLWLAKAYREERWVRLVLDYKSGNDVYAEVALQLASYARGEFVGAPDGVTELPMPAIDGGVVLHVTPKGYRLRLVDIDAPIFRAFLHAREVFRFRKDLSGRVFLADLTPEKEAAA